MTKQTVNFKQSDSYIEMITLMSEPFRIQLNASRGGYFGTIFLSRDEMVELRDAIDEVLEEA